MIDTNIFIYAYDAASFYHHAAVKLLSNDKDFDFFTATKCISEFFAVLSKRKEPFQNSYRYRFYQGILANTTLLLPDSRSFALFDQLLQKYQPVGNRVYDLEIVSVALANNVAKIATVNVKDFLSINEVYVHPI